MYCGISTRPCLGEAGEEKNLRIDKPILTMDDGFRRLAAVETLWNFPMLLLAVGATPGFSTVA